MADAVYNIELKHLQEDCEEIKGVVKEHTNDIGGLSDRVNDIEYWKAGNGSRGAEQRLQIVEKDVSDLKSCMDKVASDENISHIASAAVKEFVQSARFKDKSFVARAKAFAPYFAAACMIIATIITAVVK